MTRREARVALFELLYEMSYNTPEELDATIENAGDERDLGDEYITTAAHGIYEKLGEIDSAISEHLHGWSLERLSRVTHALLRLSVYEMFYMGIPYTISINEAVEIAKKYDHSQAPAFINGVLNAVAEARGLKEAK